MNRRTLADQPVLVAVVTAAVGAVVGLLADGVAAAAVGALAGAVVGWGVSVQSRDQVPRSLTVVVYVVVTAVMIGWWMFVRYR